MNLVKADTTKYKEIYENDVNFVKKLTEVEKFVDLKLKEYLDITSGLEPFEEPQNNREKRHIIEGLNAMGFYINNLTKTLHNFEKDFNETSKIQHETALTIDKDNNVHRLQRLAGHIETRFDAIIGVQIQERLSSYLVSFDKFEVEKNKIENSLGDDEELPFASINEYFHNLKVRHEIVSRNLILSIDIPIVQKAKWMLYKIQEFPARFNDSLLITNVGWKFLANSSNEFTKLTSLKPCIASGSSYLCEPQASIHTTSHDDCLTHAFVARVMNPQMCHTASASYERLTFIQLSNARYFYYAPADETISVTCNREKFSQLLSNSGIIALGAGCSVETSTYKLFPAQFSQSTPVEIILETGFDREDLKKIIAGEKTMLTENAFYDNVKEIHEDFYKPLKLELNTHVVRSGWNDWHTYIVAALISLIVVALIIKCCVCRFCC